MTEHKIITTPTDYQAPSGDSKRILMRSGDNGTIQQMYGSTVTNFNDNCRQLLGSQTLASSATVTGNSTSTVTSTNWSLQWEFNGFGTSISNYGGFSLCTFDAYYEIQMSGHAYCPTADLNQLWCGIRVDKGSSPGIVYDYVGGAIYNKSALGATNLPVYFHNIVLFTPSIYTGNYVNVYPAFVVTTTNPANTIQINWCTFNVRLVSQKTMY